LFIYYGKDPKCSSEIHKHIKAWITRAVLATRLNRMLRVELDLCIQDTKYWTDSQIVLHYLETRSVDYKLMLPTGWKKSEETDE